MAINSERLYDLACENLRSHLRSDEDPDRSFAVLTKDENIYDAIKYNINGIGAALEIYLAAKDELGKAKGGTAYSAFKRIIKRCENRPMVHGVWKDSEGRSCVCDGYLAVRLRKPVEGFKDVQGVDLDKIMPNGSYFTDPVELHIPTPGELKINKRKLSTGKTVYDFGDDLPMVDVKYLKDVMDCLPDAKAVVERGSTTKMIYFTSDAGDAILLPIRKNEA